MPPDPFKMIDTHAHLDDPTLWAQLPGLIDRCTEVGVHAILVPSVDEGNLMRVMQLTDSYPGVVYAMAGLHPTYVREDYKHQLDLITEHVLKHRSSLIAIGEIGLDLYWDKTTLTRQRAAFEEQLKLALQVDLPVSVHARDATAEVLEVMGRVGQGRVRGVLHCFSGTADQAQEAVDLGLTLGIGGTVTYKNSNLGNVIDKVGLTPIVLETDSPYLAPVPFRGKRNSPEHLPLIAKRIAEFAGHSADEVARLTTTRAQEVFRLPPVKG